MARTPDTLTELAQMPASSEMLARAAATVLRRPRGEPQLPRDGARLRGVNVDAAKLQRYRQVCGLPDADTLPLTYPHLLGQNLQMWLMARPGFPLPLLGLVHLANRFEQARPISVDRKLDVAVRLSASRRSDRGLEFDFVTRVDSGRVHLWEGISTYLFRLPRQTAKPREKVAPPVPPRLDRQQSLAAPADTGRRYAAVSGDYNPIHLYPLTARLFGFPRAIAHGMWTAPRCLGLLQAVHPVEVSRLDVRFRQPLLLPAQAELRSRAHDGGVEFLLVGRDDRLHVEGSLG